MISVRSSLDIRFELLGVLADSTAGATYVARERRSAETLCLQFVSWRHSSARQRERFVFEARSAARILHPNLLPVREVLEGDDGLLIVYGYEPGQTLAAALANGPLPARQAAALAMQLADALETTHRAGVIHGGLDPSCILVTESGLVKLIGFGAAALRNIEDEWQFHAAPPASAEQQAIERVRLRRVGYRAPECFTGVSPDSRSEVFSLGCVLYEMLSGKRAFIKKNSSLTVKAVLEIPPRPIAEIATGVPSHLARVLRRCLRKDADRRYQHMLDLKLDLQEFREEADFAEIVEAVHLPGPRKRWWLVPALAVVAAGLYFTVPRVLYRFIAPHGLPEPEIRQITGADAVNPEYPNPESLGPDPLSADPFVSRDGNLLVFASDRDAGNLDIYAKDLRDGKLRRITQDAADERSPALSPDGRSIAFRSDRFAGGIYVVPTDGSAPPRWVANQGRRPRFSPDGNWIAFWARTLQSEEVGGIFVIPAQGGTPRRLAADFHSALDPVWSQDSRHLLFRGARRKGAQLEFWIAPLDGSPPQNSDAHRVLRRWFINGIRPDAWVNDTLYFTGAVGNRGSVWQIRLPLASLRVEGDSLRISSSEADQRDATVAGDGRVFYGSVRDAINLWELPLDPDTGQVRGAARRYFASDGPTFRPSLSDDGKWLAYTALRNGNENVWLRNLPAGTERQITANPHTFFTPTGVVTPDGEWLAYTQYETGRTVTYVRATQGGEGAAAPATVLCNDCETPRDWSSDGRSLLYSRTARSYSIGMVERGSGVKTLLVQSDRFPILSPRFGPRDRWISFHAIESPEVRKIFALAIAGTSSSKEREWIPITSGKILDRGAQWSPNGNLLFFMSERDGRRGIYAQRLNPETHQPQGQPFVVYASNDTRRSLQNVARGVAEIVVLPDRLIFTMGELSGNIFEARPPSTALSSSPLP